MANLKELRKRIGSVTSTQKITKAMQMVAASKLRRAQEAVEAARPYAERMEKIIGSLASSLQGSDGAPKLLVGTGSDQVHLVIVATSERGLCGGFNANIVKGARQHVHELIAAGKTVKLICIGKKGFALLRREFEDRILEVIDMSHVRRLGYNDALPIAQKIMRMFDDGEFDVCTLFYAKFVTVLTQDVTPLQLIPAHVETTGENLDADLGGAVHEYEPSEEEILEDLLPRNMATQVYRVLLENAASEQGARMTAMDNATRNAGEMIDKLTLTYNRERQATITKELIEIISGAEAL